MGTIPLPALNVRQPEQPDLLGNLGRLAGLKQAQQQLQGEQLENQQRQMQIQQMQSDLDSQKAFTRAYQEAQGDPQATVQKALQYGAKTQFVNDWLKSRAELDKITEEGHEKHRHVDMFLKDRFVFFVEQDGTLCEAFNRLGICRLAQKGKRPVRAAFAERTMCGTFSSRIIEAVNLHLRAKRSDLSILTGAR